MERLPVQAGAAILLAQEVSIRRGGLRRWRDEFVAAGRDRLTGQGDAATTALENQRLTRELAERELIIGEITVANRFLKKTLDGSNGTLPGAKS